MASKQMAWFPAKQRTWCMQMAWLIAAIIQLTVTYAPCCGCDTPGLSALLHMY